MKLLEGMRRQDGLDEQSGWLVRKTCQRRRQRKSSDSVCETDWSSAMLSTRSILVLYQRYIFLTLHHQICYILRSSLMSELFNFEDCRDQFHYLIDFLVASSGSSESGGPGASAGWSSFICFSVFWKCEKFSCSGARVGYTNIPGLWFGTGNFEII